MQNKYYDVDRVYETVSRKDGQIIMENGQPKISVKRVVTGRCTCTPKYVGMHGENIYLAAIRIDDKGNVRHANSKQEAIIPLYESKKIGTSFTLKEVDQSKYDWSQKGKFEALSIAVSKGEQAEFIPVTAYGKLAEVLANFYTKSRKVLAEFHVVDADDSGNKTYYLNVIKPFESQKKNGEDAGEEAGSEPTPPEMFDEEDSDVPF